MLMGDASSAITTSPLPGVPTSGTSTTFNTSAGLPNVSIWIACIAVLSVLCTIKYVMEATGLSREQLHRLIERGTDAGSVRGILRQHHQTKIDRNDRMRGSIGVEA